FAAGRWLTVPPELAPEVHLVFLAVVVNFAAALPLSVFPAMLDGLNAFAAKSATRTIVLLLRVPAQLLAVRSSTPLLHLILTLTVFNLLESSVLAVQVYRRVPGLRFVPGQIDRATVRAVRGYSADAFLAMIAGRLAFQTDAFVIGRFINLQAITHFALANR